MGMPEIGPRVIARIETDGQSLGWAVGFDTEGKVDSYLDPFYTASLIDEGSTVWVMDDKGYLYGIPAHRVEGIVCLPASNAKVKVVSTTECDGDHAPVGNQRAKDRSLRHG